ncbi:MAG: hypothetical protein HWE22_18875 [Flavobacteriales bacterium]|nr:hypothetical protein [Flavobacteriales bacterium]
MRHLFVLMSVIMGFQVNSQQGNIHSEPLEWSFLHPVKQSWQDLGQKGSVQEALIESGEMPDPFYGLNELKFGWFEEHVWEFKSIIFLTDEQLDKEYVELEFPSIDTYGKVYVNGKLVMETANAFIPHRVQIKEHAKQGMNEIQVYITPPVMYHAKTYDEMGYQLPAPNDVHKNAVAPLTRKPQYQFGWDWSLRLNTIGFNKIAHVITYNDNRIINSTINTVEVGENGAEMEMMVELAVKKDDTLLWKSKQFGDQEVIIKNGEGRRTAQLSNPALWWPRGHGEQHLYDETWIFSKNETAIDSKSFQFGVKTSELVREEDQWGTSYYFKINGRQLFCKGADYIPQDIFPARVKDEDIVEMVETMAESNFNMVRVWGGGYYPDEIFFETCDRLGIMVWEDLMFACAMYPGDDKFIANITEEFCYQIPRIAAHASVVQFNGNNEVEVAWGNWGFQIKYGLFGKSAKEIEAAYDRVFKETALQIVKEFTSIPYIHTSPLSNWGKMEFYNHGSQHYWGVWHGKDPIEDFGKKIGRFNAEYGFQSFPEFSTLHTFSDTNEWDLKSDVMKHHQKSYVGNNMILKHAKKLYGEPANFEEFVYFSQLTQSKAVSMAIAGHRIDYPRCGGTLVWQLNDCWQVSSWSSVDYFGNWKALQYEMKKDYEDVSVVAKYNDLEDVDFYLVSDVIDTFNCEVQCEIFDLKEKSKAVIELSQQVNGQGSQPLCMKTVKEDLKKMNAHLVFTWTDEEGNQFSRSYDNIQLNREKAPESAVKMSYNRTLGQNSGVITIETTKFLKDFWISSDKFGVKFDRNFQSLLPGTHTFEITFEEEPTEEDFKMMWL